MASKAIKSKGKAAAKPISFGLRLKAWWEGYEPEQLLARQQRDNPTPEPQPERAAEPTIAADKPVDALLAEAARAEAQNAEGLAVDPWNEERIDVAQLIWGRGFCGPGGPEYVIAMSKLLAMTPELSMMHLGATLGGPARTLAEHFGVWVTGFETSDRLVQAGNTLSVMAGMAKKAPILKLDLGQTEPFMRRYDRVLADGFLSYQTEKTRFLGMIEQALKPEGLLLITEYCLSGDGSVASEDYRKWTANEPRRMSLVTQKEFAEAIANAGYALRVDEDRTLEHAELISKAWSAADKVVAQLMQQPGQEHLARVLLKEAELWSGRAAVLKSGQVQFRRFLAAKRDKSVKMMSNW